MKNLFKSIFGGKATEGTETRTATTITVASDAHTETVEAITGTKDGSVTIYTPAEVEAMTVEKALETLAEQLAERRADICSRGTTAKKLEKELEKAEKKEKEAEALATVAEAVETTSEKERRCKRYTADFWHRTAADLKAAHTEALKKEAEAVAHTEALKKKATETLEAITAGETTLEEAVANMTTEELETMTTVAGEIKKAKKEKALEKTNEATAATNTEKAVAVAVAGRHMEEGKATEKEVATVKLAKVEKEKATIMEKAKETKARTAKKVEEKVKAEVKKEYTFSKAIGTMKAEAETWQSIYTEAGIEIEVATMTPATLSSWCHIFMKVPTGRGLQIGTGRGTKAVEKWSIEALHDYIITNATLCTMTEAGEIDPTTMEAHTVTLAEAETALEAVIVLEEKLAKAKEEKKKADEEKKEADKKKAETEKITSTATVEEYEAAHTEAEEKAEEVKAKAANVRAIETTLAEVKEEAKEKTETVKEEKEATLETVEKAKKTGRGKKTTGTKKAGTKATRTAKKVEEKKADTITATETEAKTTEAVAA